MKILYGIQGTGNGHISRARTFIPMLKKFAEVDVLLSGTSSEVSLGSPVRYRVHGLGYTFGKKGGIDFIDSARKLRPVQLIRDIASLPVRDYDLVISDFEPVSARAAMRAGKMCIGLSHQAAFLSNRSPRPSHKSIIGEYIFRHYAPCSHYIGFHYQRYDRNIFTPVIGSEIRQLEKEQLVPSDSQQCLLAKTPGACLESAVKGNGNGSGSAWKPAPLTRRHAAVYLPSYDDKRLVPIFDQITHIDWHIFSKTAERPYRRGHVQVHPVDFSAYIKSLATCSWLVCGAGFETPSEALHLGKPIMAIPMAWQYEQQCNAAALKQMGVTVQTAVDRRFMDVISNWMERAETVKIDYPDQTEAVVARILNMYELEKTGTRFAV
ncbi:MAG: glycosyl transferase [Balneolaceae bacterium]|nr:MAG: glycosyl transferase [Balneolaceae bacterium]